MSEEFLVEQLDEAIDAILGRRDQIAFSRDADVLTDLAALAVELRDLPREIFKSNLKDELRRSATMTTAGTKTRPAATQAPAGYQTITPYLTVRRAEQLVEFVKNVFGGVELYRTTGSAGGLHAEVVIGDSKLMIGGYETVEEMPTALHLYVPDADAVYQRALEAGSTSLEEPVDQFYGDREAGIKDPTGNVWWIATHKRLSEPPASAGGPPANAGGSDKKVGEELGAAESYVPEGMRQVTPLLHPVGAASLIDFMKQAFGAEELSREASPEGMIHHAVVRIGDSMIEMGEAHGELAQPMPPALFMNVENLEESYERALNAGAASLQPPSDQAYGRTAWVKDAWGNVWYLVAAPAEAEKG